MNLFCCSISHTTGQSGWFGSIELSLFGSPFVVIQLTWADSLIGGPAVAGNSWGSVEMFCYMIRGPVRRLTLTGRDSSMTVLSPRWFVTMKHAIHGCDKIGRKNEFCRRQFDTTFKIFSRPPSLLSWTIKANSVAHFRHMIFVYLKMCATNIVVVSTFKGILIGWK